MKNKTIDSSAHHRVTHFSFKSVVVALAMTVSLLGGTALASEITNEDSLRAAVNAGGNISFNNDTVIQLTSPLVVTTNTVIAASGHVIILDGNHAARLFLVQSNASLTLDHISLINGSVTNADAPTSTPGGNAMGGAIYNYGSVMLASCLFSNNYCLGGKGGFDQIDAGISGGSAYGGAIYNLGLVLGTDTTFLNNTCQAGEGSTGVSYHGPGGEAFGGAIFNYAGQVILTNCTLIGNNCAGGIAGVTTAPFGHGATMRAISASKGGAVANIGGHLHVYQGSCQSNQVTSMGGAIWNSGECWIEQVRFHGNQSLPDVNDNVSSTKPPADGGAIYSEGHLVLVDSTLDENQLVGGGDVIGGYGLSWGAVNARGGAVFNAGEMAITNCTLAMNSARGGNGNNGAIQPGQSGSGLGGAIYNHGTMLVLANVTICSNRVETPVLPGAYPGAVQGGSINSDTNSVILYNTIVANSSAGGEALGQITDGGYNICSDTSCAFTLATSHNNLNPQLLALANNGGPTPTMALAANSPALDAGSDAFVVFDQRGILRPQGGAADIGAFEFGPTYSDIRLTLRSIGNAVIIQWPATAADYLLEKTSHLSVDPWTLVTDTITVQSGQNTVTHAKEPGMQFFRLKK